MLMKKTSGAIVAILLVLAFTLSSSVASADEVKIPETAAEHEAAAKTYKEEAAQNRKVAADHRAMAEAYKKRIQYPVSKGGIKNPWLEKMEKHCALLAQDAEKLAADAEKAAQFHMMRAEELEGK
jgi:hypothetical protein